MPASTLPRRARRRVSLIKRISGAFAALLAVSVLQVGSDSANASPIAGGTITVTGFRDYNANGTKDASGTGEPGLGALSIAAVCVTDSGADGVVGTADDTVATTTGVTGPTGLLSLAVPGSPCRLTAAPDSTMDPLLSASLKPGAAGKSNVQFVAAGSSASFGMNIPSDYCQAQASVALSCFTEGDNLAGANKASHNLYVFGEDTSSITAANGRATAAQIGSSWGVAYQRSTKTIFTAAFLKTHAGYGTLGPYGIYKVNPTTAGSGLPFVDLNAIGQGGSPDQHGLGSSTPNVSASDWWKDYYAMGKVGRFGLGGLTVGEDDDTLWTVNLEKKTLVELDITPSGTSPGVPTTGSAWPIPTSQCGKGAGEARPFAVTAKDGALWVGGVCEGIPGATAATDVVPQAWVLRFNPTSHTFGSAPVLSFGLGYPRACSVSSPACGAGKSADYGAWRNTYAALDLAAGSGPQFTSVTKVQPMLTGIAFVNSDLVVSFRNRDLFGNYSTDDPSNTAATFYNWPAGELLRSCTTTGATWTVENGAAGTCPGSFSRSGSASGESPGPGGKEFYWGDGFNPWHLESAAGGVAQAPGHANLQTSSNDADSTCAGGFASMSNAGGGKVGKADIWTNACGTQGVPGSAPGGRFGKANGIGDLELLCNQAPLEIGNRVWRDADSDGTQDPGEPGIAAVTVRLFDATNTLVGSTVTAADGSYVFGGVSNVGMLGSNTVKVATAYTVRLDNAANFGSGNPLQTLTSANVGPNLYDSDATLTANPAGSPAGSWPVAKVTTGGAGSNDHSIDFGFVEATPDRTTTTTAVVKTTTTTVVDRTTTTTATKTEVPTVPPPTVTIVVQISVPTTVPPVPTTAPKIIISPNDDPYVEVLGSSLPFTG